MVQNWALQTSTPRTGLICSSCCLRALRLARGVSFHTRPGPGNESLIYAHFPTFYSVCPQSTNIYIYIIYILLYIYYRLYYITIYSIYIMHCGFRSLLLKMDMEIARLSVFKTTLRHAWSILSHQLWNFDAGAWEEQSVGRRLDSSEKHARRRRSGDEVFERCYVFERCSS